MHVLFANTGVQVVCIPLQAGRRYTTAQIGYGWQYCHCLSQQRDEDHEDQEGASAYPYIQWQVVQANVSKLFLAVDTSLGDPDEGYFCDPTSLAGDFRVALEGLLGLNGSPLQGIPKIELCLRASSATAGEAKAVHLVVDFGNSRTGALLLEVAGEVAQSAEMTPFELLNRYQIDIWNDEGEQVGKPTARWFSSKTRWCNAPYLPPLETTKKEYFRETVKGFLGKKTVAREREINVVPNLFDDYSMVRMGKEVDDICQIMHAKGDFRTGVSSPKRYLWAHDASWLEGAFWYMADPHDRCRTDNFASKLQGPLLKYLHEDDRDFLLNLEEEEIKDEQWANEVPIKPQHAPRTLMTAAIYELLCQTFLHINSLGYRSHTSDEARARELRSLTMTFPTGMFQPERERFAQQAQKAIEIFARTLGKHQKAKPTLTFSIDEASAVHLTYIWSELRMLGQDPGLWFGTLARSHGKSKIQAGGGEGADEVAEATATVAAGRRRNRGRMGRPGRGAGGGGSASESTSTMPQELRIACIDIGGGTTDMMIASYRYQPGIDDSIEGQVLHQDGVSIAGDQLIKRMLEKIIVPAFSEAASLEEEDIQLLFGPEVPKNRGFSSFRIDWINRLFVPLAERYLQLAVDDITDEEISHTDPDIVDPVVVESLQQQCNKLRGPGYYNVQQDVRLTYEKETFEDVVHEVFDDLLFDFCGRIVDHDADVVLLAGQPSKLGYLQELVRMYVPLPASRIIPMFNHYAGNWYPYQDVKGHAPGLIVDPKSAVVVGAAIEFLARHGMLPQFKFAMHGKETENTYFWGVMTESTSNIRDERILFSPVDDETRDEWTEFTTIAQRVVIGRKMVGDPEAQASPIYALKMDAGNRIGQTEVTVKIKRIRATEAMAEHLKVESVQGVVAGQPAVLDENVLFNWRTLADERYFLDTGGLDNIDVDGR
ncbi:MAG: virulence factor SrfB [Pirellulaceae bacterium]